MPNSEISKRLGTEWEQLITNGKTAFLDEAKKLQQEHKEMCPDYKYRSGRNPRASNAPRQMPYNKPLPCSILENTQSFSTPITRFGSEINANFLRATYQKYPFSHYLREKYLTNTKSSNYQHGSSSAFYDPQEINSYQNMYHASKSNMLTQKTSNKHVNNLNVKRNLIDGQLNQNENAMSPKYQSFDSKPPAPSITSDTLVKKEGSSSNSSHYANLLHYSKPCINPFSSANPMHPFSNYLRERYLNNSSSLDNQHCSSSVFYDGQEMNYYQNMYQKSTQPHMLGQESNSNSMDKLNINCNLLRGQNENAFSSYNQSSNPIQPSQSIPSDTSVESAKLFSSSLQYTDLSLDYYQPYITSSSSVLPDQQDDNSYKQNNDQQVINKTEMQSQMFTLDSSSNLKGSEYYTPNVSYDFMYQ